jgi:hypothetical protein
VWRCSCAALMVVEAHIALGRHVHL